MSDHQRILRWALDDAGGGVAWLFGHAGDKVKQKKYVFDSPDRSDQLPQDLAKAIRANGRPSGEVKLPPG